MNKRDLKLNRLKLRNRQAPESRRSLTYRRIRRRKRKNPPMMSARTRPITANMGKKLFVSLREGSEVLSLFMSFPPDGSLNIFVSSPEGAACLFCRISRSSEVLKSLYSTSNSFRLSATVKPHALHFPCSVISALHWGHFTVYLLFFSGQITAQCF